MGQRVTAGERRFARCIACAAQFIPHRVIHRQIEIGQDDSALRQLRYSSQQPRQRWCCAGNTGGHEWRAWRVRTHPAGSFAKQDVAPCGSVTLTALLKLGQPQALDGGEQVEIVAPMIGKVANKVDHAVGQQFLGRDLFHKQSVHHLPGFHRQFQQRGAFGCLVAPHVADQCSEAQPAKRGIGGRRNSCTSTERIEQRSQRFVEVEITHKHHARHQ